jgi:hypothetical protein
MAFDAPRKTLDDIRREPPPGVATPPAVVSPPRLQSSPRSTLRNDTHRSWPQTTIWLNPHDF